MFTVRTVLVLADYSIKKHNTADGFQNGMQISMVIRMEKLV